jgi:hypothetical protein
MSIRRPGVRVVALFCVGCVVVLAFTFVPRQRAAALDGSWDCDRLARELGPLGYRSAAVAERDGALGGFYLAHRDDPRGWQEIASRPRVEPQRRWKGLVVVKPAIRCGEPPPFRETMQAGPFLFYGDPHELDRIAAQLGLPR